MRFLFNSRHRAPRFGAALALLLLTSPVFAATNYTLLGWSEQGMYFIDSDYSVFGIHPPGNTLHAQIVENINGTQARLLTNPAAYNITVTYQAVGDPDGSTNSTSIGKNNFWDYAFVLYGSNLVADQGFGSSMPGLANTPQPMTYETNYGWFTAAGIPITPYDDAGKFNPYPLFRLTAKVSSTVVTNLDVVVGVTDEMDCSLCHASGSNTNAMPAAGWVNERNPLRDYRLNILRLHDERQSTNPVYAVALASNSYNAAGLYANVTVNLKPVLCTRCHASSIVPGSGTGSIKPLTRAMHAHHATVIDPRDGNPLDSETNRATCYTCHGGALTHFLRGAMATADSTNGMLAIQCQSCHGSMATVGATNRVGWRNEPVCQSCHVGDALNTVSGQIRFTTAFSNGAPRSPAIQTFATDTNVPSAGFAMFNFSKGHGNLACAACHGPPHAEFPSTVRNDNLRSLQLQGHSGVMAECEVCHQSQNIVASGAGGPHGMHPHNYEWADGLSAGGHEQFQSSTACGPCHGTNSSLNKQGTFLSYARGNRSYPGLPIGGDVTFWQGQQIGCTHCHSGTAAPTAGNTSTSTTAGVTVAFTLTSSTNRVRIVTQGGHGLVAITNKTATYMPEAGFVGTDKFVFASAKPQLESSSATGTVVVTEAFTVGDGIPDWWRQKYFGGDGKTTNATSCSTADPDGDGLNNREEYRAATDPNDDLSTVRVFATQPTGSNARIGFHTTVDRQYAVDVSTNPLTNTWQPVASNIWGRNGAMTVIATNGIATNRGILRVRVQ